MVTPQQKRQAVNMLTRCGVSQRQACAAVGLSRSTYWYQSKRREQEAPFRQQVLEVAFQYPRFGYRRVAAWLRRPGAPVNPKRVYRVWREWGLRLPRKRPRRRRGIAPDLPIPLASYPNAVWCYDFIVDRLANGRRIKLLCVLDEYTRECLGIEVANSIRSPDVIRMLQRLMQYYGKPAYLRSDNGPEFTAQAVMRWLKDHLVGPVYIKPGSPWQNGFVESFHGKLRDECLNREYFACGNEAQVLIEEWRQFYNTKRPHSALGYQTPSSMRQASEHTDNMRLQLSG